MLKKIVISFILLLCWVNSSYARDYIRIVGSSTVYPFITVAAEEFGVKNGKAPIVESTGTGGGFKLFCSGIGVEFADIVTASRKIKESERALCDKHSIKNIIEVPIGYDGIALAETTDGPFTNLTLQHIFLALAYEVPQGGNLVINPYKNWHEIDKSLPDIPIGVYGPPVTSGTRDSFNELVMQRICVTMPAFIKAYPDNRIRKSVCSRIREDGRFIEIGENDNLMVQKLTLNPHNLGILGAHFVDENSHIIRAVRVDGMEASHNNIENGRYPIARKLYIYLKGEHLEVASYLKEFVLSLLSEEAVGRNGYLTLRGLIPISKQEREKIRKIIAAS